MIECKFDKCTGCFWWECFACNGQSYGCEQFKGIKDKDYLELYHKYQDDIQKARKPVYEDWKIFKEQYYKYDSIHTAEIAEGQKMKKISIIQWNDYTDDCHVPYDDLLVYVKDDHGDHTNYYITYAYHLYEDVWIKDNDWLSGKILMWARMPECEDAKEVV